MKNTIKSLINQVKKAIDSKSSAPVLTRAYADRDGALIARSFKNNADIIIFVAGIVDDVSKREKLYTKDELTFAADTGIFNGGIVTDDTSIFEAPAENFTYCGDISADDLSAAAYAASADNTRPVLTAVNISNDGYLQACDGFRAYRKKLDGINTSAFDGNGLMIPAAAAGFNFAGAIAIYNGAKYIKLLDTAGGIVLYCKKLDGAFINMETIYTGYGKDISSRVKIKNIKLFKSVLKSAIAAGDRRRSEIALKVREGFIDYYIPALDMVGSVEAITDGITPAGFNITLNARYIYDAVINQDCNIIEFMTSRVKPIFVSNEDGAKALLLPIRDNGEYYFDKYDAENTPAAPAVSEARTEAPAPAAVEDDTPAADPVDVTTEAEAPAEAAPEAPAVSSEDAEAEAIAEINARQNKENKFVNVSSEDVAKVLARKAAEISEELPPEIIKARAYYKRLYSCGFKPSEIQEADAEIIYKSNRDLLQPIARQAGGLYIDTLSIIAAIMAAFENK